MTHFTRRTLKINGIDTVVLEAGSGPPLVFLHGAGTVTGFDFAESWSRKFRVVIPYHPGFGPSADDPAITEIHDYVLHYFELFEALELRQFRLVGQSMGGFIATKFAVEHGARVEKLVLVCPIGLPMPPGQPTVNFLAVPPQELPALLGAQPANGDQASAGRRADRPSSSPSASRKPRRPAAFSAAATARSTKSCRATCIGSRCRRCSSGVTRQADADGAAQDMGEGAAERDGALVRQCRPPRARRGARRRRRRSPPSRGRARGARRRRR